MDAKPLSDPSTHPYSPPPRLPASQVVALLVVSLVLWFLAAQFIRILGPAVFMGASRVWTFALTLPVAAGLVLLIRVSPRVPPGQTMTATALAMLPAMLCDGVALPWTPALYGGDPAVMVVGAAWLLWGLAACLLSALLFSHCWRGARLDPIA